MASVFLEQWHLFFPKVSAVWRHFLIFLHARVSISQQPTPSPHPPFCSLPFSLSPPSPFPFYPAPLITSLSLSLSQFPIFKLGSFQNSDFRRCTTLQSVISVTVSFIIHCTSKTLECNTWPEFEQKYMGYLVSFRQLLNAKHCHWGYIVLYSWAAEEFHMNKPLACILLSLHTRDLIFSQNDVYRKCLYLWGLLICTSKQLFILICRGRLGLVVNFFLLYSIFPKVGIFLKFNFCLDIKVLAIRSYWTCRPLLPRKNSVVNLTLTSLI